MIGGSAAGPTGASDAGSSDGAEVDDATISDADSMLAAAGGVSPMALYHDEAGAGTAQHCSVHIDAHEIATRRRQLLIRFHRQVAIDDFHAGSRRQGDVPAGL